MTEKLREQVSALADDALLESEHALLVRRFGTDRSLRLCWERYYLIGEAMRHGLPQVDTRGFADRVMAALEGDKTEAEDNRTGVLARFGKALAGVAVAASVAAVAVIGLRHDIVPSSQTTAGAAEIVPGNSPQLNATLASYTTGTTPGWNDAAPEVQAQLGNYLISHNETASALAHPGVLPYFSIATYDSRVVAARTQTRQVPTQNGRYPRNR